MLCRSWQCAVWHNSTFLFSSVLGGILFRCTDCNGWDVLLLQKRWALLFCLHSLYAWPWLQGYTEELHEKLQDFWNISFSYFGCLCLIQKKMKFLIEKWGWPPFLETACNTGMYHSLQENAFVYICICMGIVVNVYCQVSWGFCHFIWRAHRYNNFLGACTSVV